MARYISKPFVYLENVVGVELNFNKIFYKPKRINLFVKRTQHCDEWAESSPVIRMNETNDKTTHGRRYKLEAAINGNR